MTASLAFRKTATNLMTAGNGSTCCQENTTTKEFYILAKGYFTWKITILPNCLSFQESTWRPVGGFNG